MSVKARALWGFQHGAESVRAGDTIDVEPETFDKLKENGLVEKDNGSGASHGSTIDLDGMSVSELREFAATKGIDLGDATKKDDIRSAILKAIAEQAA
ncbi:hypothetical protein NS365_04590 [Aureimonas ureilytica]|uniref:Rho termination factor-like N-terminal domain-containing protein n=1 Tax=Aureimonas ureilytica TaxID=401562 RepID=A0A175RVJ5_9HYPH|nr:Rho termination factor N-terminal domain-containing protein [Aureimonas ureilytica]KTR07338.1 hypothetical protein NS365_04590 [Aureimonas ureilytica]